MLKNRSGAKEPKSIASVDVQIHLPTILKMAMRLLVLCSLFVLVWSNPTWVPFRDTVCDTYKKYTVQCPWYEFVACESQTKTNVGVNATIAEQVASVIIMPRTVNDANQNMQYIEQVLKAVSEVMTSFCINNDPGKIASFATKVSKCAGNAGCTDSVSKFYVNQTLLAAGTHGTASRVLKCPTINYDTDPAYAAVPDRAVAALSVMGWASYLVNNSTAWINCTLSNTYDTLTLDQAILFRLLGELSPAESAWLAEIGSPNSGRRLSFASSASPTRHLTQKNFVNNVKQFYYNTDAGIPPSDATGLVATGLTSLGQALQGYPPAAAAGELIEGAGIAVGAYGDFSEPVSDLVNSASDGFQNLVGGFVVGGNAAIDDLVNGGDSISATNAANNAFDNFYNGGGEYDDGY